MLDSPAVHNTILGITCGVYVVHIILSATAAGGGTSVFPYSQVDMAKKFELIITPASATISIWVVIFTYQAIWLIYAVVSTIRHGISTSIQSKQTLLNFLFYTVTVMAWLFVWARADVIGGFICLVVASFFIEISLGYACADLHNFIETYGETADSKVDIRCHRYLIQNGIIFNATWITVATCLNTAIVLCYELNVSDESSSLVALSLLGFAIIIWFGLENWILEEYTKYTFTNYIVVIVALLGILLNGKTTDNSQLNGLTIGLLVISGVLFLLRIIFLIKKSCNPNTNALPKSIQMKKMRKSYTY